MKQNKGITLITLVMYILLTMIALGLINTLVISFRKNLNNINSKTAQGVEFDKLNAQLLKETKTLDNLIDKNDLDDYSIKFKNGNTYTYSIADKAVYLNKEIIIADNVQMCTFSLEDTSKEQTLTVKIEINDKSQVVKYVITKDIKILPGEKATANANYQGAIIPAGFTLSGIEGEYDIDEGIVIYDIPAGTTVNWTETKTVGTETYQKVQCDYNQFVWIPVENPVVTEAEIQALIKDTTKPTVVDEKAAVDYIVANEKKYPMAIEYKTNGVTNYRGILYEFKAGTDSVSITVRNFSTTANYNDNSVTYNREPAKLSGISTTTEQALDLQTEYNNIVESIKEQKGFWVARYELSHTTVDNIKKAESKRGKTVSTASTSSLNKWYGLYETCKNVNLLSGVGMKSSMIFGSQWDQMMIWMRNARNIKDNTKFYIIDSSNMGNYADTSGGKAKVSGYIEDYSVKHIFDLASNLYDWTIESYLSSNRVARGGDFYLNSSGAPASYRSTSASPEKTDSYYSARFILYVSP